MVKKPDWSWRCCSDYRQLNNVTVPDSYLLPNMMDFSSRVAGCSIFSEIDLCKIYYQIPMHPADIIKTALLAQPKQEQLALMVDAFADHVGAALQQQSSLSAALLPLAFSQKSWSLRRQGILPLTGSSSSVYPASVPYATCWTPFHHLQGQ